MADRCKGCGAELGPRLLICPACHRLVHAEQLSTLAAQAEQATKDHRIADALSSWRTAFALLPVGTRQATEVDARIQALSAQVGAPAAPKAQRKLAAGLGAGALFLWKFKVVLVMGLSKAKFLLLGLTKLPTLLSMFLAMGVYWTLWGWKFAVGFVLGIYVHEMGHVMSMRAYGLSASAPMFIPGLGAFVRLNHRLANVVEDARVGLAGPRWGAFATLFSAALFFATRNELFAALAHVNALINLFNLIPFWQLDGGRAFRALNKRDRLICAGVLGGGWYFTGETLVLLVALGAAARGFVNDAAAQTDRRTFYEYALLSAGLCAMSHWMAPFAR